MKFIRKFQKKIGKAIQQYELIQPNDKILVGLSGGIDSMSLLLVLQQRSLRSPFPFTVEALHVSIDGVPNEVDTEAIVAFCEKNSIKLHRISTAIDYSTDSRNSPCYLCSSYRRNAVFRFAEENNFQKLAFGHHMDDILETLLMNMVSQAEISTMPPLLKMRNWTFDLIRPFCMVQKSEIESYAKQYDIVPAEGKCNFEQRNSRTDIGDILDRLVEINPQAKVNLYNSMGNVVGDYLA